MTSGTVVGATDRVETAVFEVKVTGVSVTISLVITLMVESVVGIGDADDGITVGGTTVVAGIVVDSTGSTEEDSEDNGQKVVYSVVTSLKVVVTTVTPVVTGTSVHL